MNTRRPVHPLLAATLAGLVLQIMMVLSGHFNAAIASLFAPLGMAISLLAGILYTVLAAPSARVAAAKGGAVAGATCAFVGILVSYLLGDVTAAILMLGTLSSAATGAIGGLTGRLLKRGAESGARK